MDDQLNQSRISRRNLLKIMGVSVGALAATPLLAACAPAAAPATSSGAGGAPAAEATKLELWTFVNTHARWFRQMAEEYAANNSGFELNVTEIAAQEMFDKLLIALQSGGVGAPDIADIEQGFFGNFIRGDVGLVDLTDRLSDYKDDLVPGRQQLYTWQGKTYGIEHALTPVVLYYRADLWEAAGADPAEFTTWDDFIVAAGGLGEGVKALPFPIHDLMLRQRGADYFDADGNVTLDSELSIETLQWILNLRDSSGVGDIPDGGDWFNPSWWGAVKEGKWASTVGADWYAGFFKDNVPELSGKWKAAKLPGFTADGVRTSCWGGTGATIIKFSKNIEPAWDFLEFAMLSVDGNVKRFQETTLFPPFIPAMSDERLQAPDEYFSGQNLGGLYAEVGPSVPAQYQSPYRAELNTRLNPVMQEIWNGTVSPADGLKQVADEVRATMAEDQ